MLLARIFKVLFIYLVVLIGFSSYVFADMKFADAVQVACDVGHISAQRYNWISNTMEHCKGPGPTPAWTAYGLGSGDGDFLASGAVSMTGNLRLNGNWLSNDGGSEGVFVDTAGNVGTSSACPNSSPFFIVEDS